MPVPTALLKTMNTDDAKVPDAASSFAASGSGGRRYVIGRSCA